MTGNTQGSVLFGLINHLLEEFLKAVYFCIISLYTFNPVYSSYYNFFLRLYPCLIFYNPLGMFQIQYVETFSFHFGCCVFLTNQFRNVTPFYRHAYVLRCPILASPVRFAFPTRPEQVLSKHKVSRGSHGKTSANLRISGIASLKTWLIHCKISFLSSPREPG